jgi:hypothetical protein
MLVDQARVLVRSAGFWSVWATVLSTELEDDDAVGTLLTSDAAGFPGTNDTALGGA